MDSGHPWFGGDLEEAVGDVGAIVLLFSWERMRPPVAYEVYKWCAEVSDGSLEKLSGDEEEVSKASSVP